MTTYVFLDSEVKSDGINMLEWSKLMELTLVGGELGDHLKESSILEKDPWHKKWKAEEAFNHQCMLSTTNTKMRRFFFVCGVY